jgi:hydroxymethylbilane synthase
MSADPVPDRLVRVATRSSALALAQSGLVAAALVGIGSGAGGGPLRTEIVRASTTGDTDRRELTEIGGRGVFVGEVRDAVLSGRADIAVHSAKDLPVAAEPGLVLAAVPERADAADVLVLRVQEAGTPAPGVGAAALLSGLPAGARIGTGSPRRGAELESLAAAAGRTVEIVPIRGNIDTRLHLVADKTVDAVVVAAAGLVRLGRVAEPAPGLVARRLPADLALPAPAQGALAVECRTDAPGWLRTALAALDDAPSHRAVDAERAVLSALDAGCLTPIGALAEPAGPDRLRLRASLAGPDGLIHRVSVEGAADQPSALGAHAGLLLAAALPHLLPASTSTSTSTSSSSS